jgi:hypothetical protein
VAKWRPAEAPRVEPPVWYRVYDPAMWNEPDAQETAMMCGCPLDDWPVELHDIHARRRWGEAKHRYRRERPDLATQEFEDLVSEERRARRAEGMS